MKKAIIILLAIMMLTGCTRTYDDRMKTRDDNVNLIVAEDRDNIKKNQSNIIFIGGIVIEVKNNTITLADVEGIEGQSVLTIVTDDETEWNVPKDMIKSGSFLTADISPNITRSVPPQSAGLRIVSVNDIILGEVMKIDDTSITLKPKSGFNANEEIILRLSGKTQWQVDKDSVTQGQNIRVLIGNRMTASIPPKVDCLAIMSIENAD